MVVFENFSFLKEDGSEPANCQVSPTQRIYVELLFRTSTYLPEVLNEIGVTVHNESHVCTKKFFTYLRCCLKNRSIMTYMWRTPPFLLARGIYHLHPTALVSGNDCTGLTYCSESHYTIPEVSC